MSKPTYDEKDPICFFGRLWLCREGDEQPPQNNRWKKANVSVDNEGNLNLTLNNVQDIWSAAEIKSKEPIKAYGTYRIFIATDVSNLDKNVVFGSFIYQDDTHELDIEFRRDNEVQPSNIVMAVQPAIGNQVEPYDYRVPTSCAWICEICWTETSVRMRVLLNNEGKSNDTVIHEWTYTAPSNTVPQPGKAYLFINVYMLENRPPAKPLTIKVTRAEFIPQ